MNKKTTIENLYKKSATETSPKDLDNLILAQAKADCSEKPNKTRTANRTWLYGLSTAAVFVMGLSMIINLQTINDQAMLPIEFEKALLKEEITEPLESKKSARKYTPETKHKKDSKSQIISTELLLESPVPQADRVNAEPVQVGAVIEEVMQEKVENTTLSRNLINTPEKESQQNMDVYASENKPVAAKKQESFEQPEITSYNTTQVIVRNEDDFTPTQRKIVKAVELHDKLKQFQSLIDDNKKAEAEALLEQLYKDYPGYDFNEYYEILQNQKYD